MFNDLNIENGRNSGRKELSILSKDAGAMPVYTKTGKDFGYLIMATLWMKTGEQYDLLFDYKGDYVTNSPYLKALCEYFNRSFQPGTIDGKQCLISKSI